jgi:hypothetical protein
MSFNSLTTVESRKEYLRDLQKKIGNCSSVRNEHPEDYLELKEAFKRHPRFPEKFEGLKDVSFRKRGAGFDTTLIFTDGNTDDVSLTKQCAAGIGPSLTALLKNAMRMSIQPQIDKYRSSLLSPKCEICKGANKIEIDHHSDSMPFEKLYKNFMKTNSFPIPTDFDSNMHSKKTFKEKDKNFKDAWNKYHEDHSILRPLCQSCNGSQAKYKGKE